MVYSAPPKTRGSSVTPPSRLSDALNSPDSLNGSLRGTHHNKVPDIPGKPINTLLPDLTDSAIKHPEPFYYTQNVVLRVPDGRPPWMAFSRVKEAAALDRFRADGRFNDRVVDDIIRAAVIEYIQDMGSYRASKAKYRSRLEANINKWMEKYFLPVEVTNATRICVWEQLWDAARRLSREDAEELDTEYGSKMIDSTIQKTFKDKYNRPLTPAEGQQVIGKQYGELEYHLNRYMQRGSMMENYAIQKLQEQIITQVAAKVMLDESYRFMEDEVSTLDDQERAKHPPRHP